MAKYIDAEIAEKNIKETILGASEFAVDIRNAALECIRITPAADVKEVVRGKWVDIEIIHGLPYATCSVCGTRSARDFVPENMEIRESFCKSCGADMRGVE